MTQDTSEPLKISKPKPGLYIVATPIGNLRDITYRAIDTLAAADVIACEDTRVTAKLLAAHDIPTATAPYHEHNAAKMRPTLMRRLQNGEIVALVSDAGTPLISDPGYKLVREAIDKGVPVTPIPGASAPLTALSAAGLPTDQFLFAGFLPTRTAQRRGILQSLASIPTTLVFFESPHRLAASLTDMDAVLGSRQAVMARELTKRYEEFRRGMLGELAAHYAEAGAPKGEIVLIVGPPGVRETVQEDIDTLLRKALNSMSIRDAAATVSTATGKPRREVYTRALELDGGE
jgi:16S rRNA (cytidine1402-2'-O)-methyltransferase